MNSKLVGNRAGNSTLEHITATPSVMRLGSNTPQESLIAISEGVISPIHTILI